MTDDRAGRAGDLSPGRAGAFVAIAALLATLPGLGSTRLSYHEAIVAQGAREMVASGDWLVPGLDGRPWPEKPPIAHWLVAVSATLGSRLGVGPEAAARFPSAIGAVGLALAVATFARRRFGPSAGLLAGLAQAVAPWAVLRGRLAEADLGLACLVAWILVGFDALRDPGELGRSAGSRRRLARLVLLGLGATALAKGVGFGAALALAAMVAALVWDRDRATARALLDPVGLAVAALIALAWPLAVAARYPEAVGLWTTHVADRLADRPEVFAGRSPWWWYAPIVLGLALPWTPIALFEARRSIGRARRDRLGADRLLIAWAVAPIALLSLATIKNAHYAIHALPPWSVWGALGLARLMDRLAARRGRDRPANRVRIAAGLAIVAAAIGVGFGVMGDRLDRRGVEWGFYAEVARKARPDEPVVLVYDDYDRLPYPTPFGPFPHDLAVRLYYLDRPARWLTLPGSGSLPTGPFSAVARARDLATLRRVGRVEEVAQGPPARWDRTFTLYRVTPDPAIASEPPTLR